MTQWLPVPLLQASAVPLQLQRIIVLMHNV